MMRDGSHNEITVRTRRASGACADVTHTRLHRASVTAGSRRHHRGSRLRFDRVVPAVRSALPPKETTPTGVSCTAASTTTTSITTTNNTTTTNRSSGMHVRRSTAAGHAAVQFNRSALLQPRAAFHVVCICTRDKR